MQEALDQAVVAALSASRLRLYRRLPDMVVEMRAGERDLVVQVPVPAAASA